MPIAGVKAGAPPGTKAGAKAANKAGQQTVSELSTGEQSSSTTLDIGTVEAQIVTMPTNGLTVEANVLATKGATIPVNITMDGSDMLTSDIDISPPGGTFVVDADTPQFADKSLHDLNLSIGTITGNAGGTIDADVSVKTLVEN